MAGRGTENLRLLLKERGGPGQSCWPGRGKGRERVLWLPSSFFVRLPACAPARETSCSSGPPSLGPLTLRGTLTRVVLWRHIPPRPNAGLESHGEGEAGGCYCSKTGGGKRSDTIQCGLLQNTADRKGTREQQSVSCCHGLPDTFFIVRCWTGELGLVLRPPTSTPGPPLRRMTKGRR